MDRLRLSVSAAYQLSLATSDAGGAPVTVDTATAALSITDGAAVAVLTGAAPTIGEGLLSYNAAASVMPALDTYSALWSGEVDGVACEWPAVYEVCGGVLFEVAELRAHDPAFADAALYPESLVQAARTAAEQRLERACRLAFVPRARRVTLAGDGGDAVTLPDNAVRSVTSVSVDGVALTAEELAALDVREWGRVRRTDGLTFAEGAVVAAFYEHGEDRPDEPVRQACMLLAREYLVRSSLSSRATVEATDVGFFRLSVAGPERPTGLPEVDAVIREFGRLRPRVG